MAFSTAGVSSAESELNLTTLICKILPQSYAKKALLKEHFEQFGEVTKILASLDKGLAHVTFANHEQAAQAKQFGAIMAPGIEIKMSWKVERRTSQDTKSVFSRLKAGNVGGPGKLSKLKRLSNSKPTIKSTVTTLERKQAVGLYDDLPPAKDLGDNSVLQQPQAKRTSKALFGKSTLISKNASSVPDWGESSAQADTATKVLFGKPKLSSNSTPAVSDLGESSTQAEAVPKLLFGKPVLLSKNAPAASNWEEGSIFEQPKSEATPKTLFRKPKLSSSESAAPFTTFQGESRFGQKDFIADKVELQESSKSPASQHFSHEAKTIFGKEVKFAEIEENVENGSGSSDFEQQNIKPRMGKLGNKVSSTQLSTHVFGSPLQPSMFEKSSLKQSVPVFSIRRSSPVHSRLGPRVTRSISPSSSGIQSLSSGFAIAPSPAPVLGEIKWMLPRSMQSLAAAPALTTAEKYGVLEKRDKILRIATTKEQDLSKARATIGICPDMCPERERYIREERRRVHVFEMIPGTEAHPQIDHRKAVKEYSRSSADQDEPLPNELRPAHVLSETMLYLCKTILDLGGDGEWEDWFDFLWNRTRAIRKDITQQHLCDQTAVDVVEKCARFHIFCAERLCMEEPMVFDTKINNENLTKCLQTLKELYADLISKGICCKNEAEFRGYVVLMNLNEGDTQRQVQQLRPEIRNSPEIIFALSVYSALNQNNYVKFFKLVRSTTFLNACILHRYFTQIRYEALQIMLHAYTAGASRKAQISYPQLCSLLHFENELEGEADSFMQHFGFPFDDGPPELIRDYLVEPESSLAPYRAISLVESKLNTTVGEAVYGSPLPEGSLEPTFSFDDQGYFIGIIQSPNIPYEYEYVEPEDQAAVHEPAPISLQRFEDIPSSIVNANIKDVAKMIIIELLDEMGREIAKQSTLDAKVEYGAMQFSAASLLDEVINLFARQVVCECVNEEKAVREADALARRKALFAKACSHVMEEIVGEAVDIESLQLARNTVRDCQYALQQQQNDRVSLMLQAYILRDDMANMVKEVAEEVHHEDVIMRLQKLEECERKTRVIRTRRFYNTWKKFYGKRVQMLITVKQFPAGPMLSLGKRPNDLRVAEGTLHMGKKCRLNLEPMPEQVDVELDRKLQFAVVERQLRIALSNKPINVGHIVKNTVQRQQREGGGMVKLLLYLPNENCEENQLLADWLTLKFSSGTVSVRPNRQYQGKLLSLYHIPSVREDIRVCVRSFRQDDITEQMCCTWGANCLIYLLPYVEHITDNYWQTEANNLLAFVQCKPRDPPLPLLIISPLSEIDTDQLRLRDLLDNQYVCEVKVDRLDNTESYTTELVQSVSWLVEKRSLPPLVMCDDLRSYIDIGLTNHFLCHLYENQKNRLSKDLLNVDPNSVIGLYNSTLRHLVDTATDESLQMISWPPEEFHNTNRDSSSTPWNSVSGLAHTARTVESYLLPLFIYTVPHSEKWEVACQDMWHYVNRLTSTHPLVPPGPLVARIRKLLLKTESSFKSKCRRRFHHAEDCRPLYVNSPWPDFIVACVDFVLSDVDKNRAVFYREDQLANCTLDSDWLQVALSADGLTFSGTMEKALQESRLSSSDGLVFSEHDHHQNNDDSFFSLDLIYSMNEELQASKMFEENLHAAYMDDNSVISPVQEHATNNCLDDSALSTVELAQVEKTKHELFEQFLMNAIEEC